MARGGKPQPRSAPGSQPFGRYGDNRRVWVETYIGTFAMMIYPEVEPEEGAKAPEAGEGVQLAYINHGRVVNMNLTALTHEELMLVKEVIDRLFVRAEPVVKLRDRMAQDASDQGDDSFVRNYRPVPRLIVRKGTDGKDGQGVHLRYEDVPVRPSPGDGAVEGVPVTGAGLADGGSEDRRPANNPEAPDQSSFLREMGELEDS